MYIPNTEVVNHNANRRFIQNEDETNLLQLKGLNIKKDNYNKSGKPANEMYRNNSIHHIKIAKEVNNVSLNLTTMDYILGTTQIETLNPYLNNFLNTNMKIDRMPYNQVRRSIRNQNRNIETLNTDNEQLNQFNKMDHEDIDKIDMCEPIHGLGVPFEVMKKQFNYKQLIKENCDTFLEIKEDLLTNSKCNNYQRSKSNNELESKIKHSFMSDLQRSLFKTKKTKKSKQHTPKRKKKQPKKKKKKLNYRTESLNSYFKRKRHELDFETKRNNQFEIENSHVTLVMSKHDIDEYKSLVITRRQYNEVINKRRLQNIIEMGKKYKLCKIVEEVEEEVNDSCRKENDLKRKFYKTKFYCSSKKPKNKTNTHNKIPLCIKYNIRKRNHLGRVCYNTSRNNNNPKTSLFNNKTSQMQKSSKPIINSENKF